MRGILKHDFPKFVDFENLTIWETGNKWSEIFELKFYLYFCTLFMFFVYLRHLKVLLWFSLCALGVILGVCHTLYGQYSMEQPSQFSRLPFFAYIIFFATLVGSNGFKGSEKIQLLYE